MLKEQQLMCVVTTSWDTNNCCDRVVMASGWESQGPGFKPRLLQATFDPELT